MGFLTTSLNFQPVGNITRAEVFRVSSTTYQTLPRAVRTHGWARMAYIGNSPTMYTPWYRFFPGPDPTELVIPVPQIYYQAGDVSRILEIRQRGLRNGGTPVPFDVKVEEFF